jgi:hypothetical protein
MTCGKKNATHLLALFAFTPAYLHHVLMNLGYSILSIFRKTTTLLSAKPSAYCCLSRRNRRPRIRGNQHPTWSIQKHSINKVPSCKLSNVSVNAYM